MHNTTTDDLFKLLDGCKQANEWAWGGGLTDWKGALAAGAIAGASVLSPGAAHADQAAKPAAVVQPAAEEDAVAKVIAGEAAGEGTEGMTAVACVIQNRLKKPWRFGRTAVDVATKPKQFSAWDDKDLMKRNYKDAKNEADKIASQIGSLKDITGGADHYVAKWLYDKVQADPEWAKENKVDWILRMTKTKEIGKHIFLKEK
jgi:spore germination cell wall hydrolase CwlJ-like protein